MSGVCLRVGVGCTRDGWILRSRRAWLSPPSAYIVFRLSCLEFFFIPAVRTAHVLVSLTARAYCGERERDMIILQDYVQGKGPCDYLIWAVDTFDAY